MKNSFKSIQLANSAKAAILEMPADVQKHFKRYDGEFFTGILLGLRLKRAEALGIDIKLLQTEPFEEECIDLDAVEDISENTFEESGNDLIAETPFIPDEVYENLPDILKEATKVFDDKREKDLVLTSAIVLLGGCFPNVSGTYRRLKVYPNLYSLVLAPPASKKGSAVFARKLIEQIDKSIIEKSSKDFLEQKSKLKKEGTDSKEISSKLPDYKSLIIAGNTSHSAMVNDLDNNDGVGIICESEADTLTNSFNQEWSDINTLLRVAFHHEDYMFTRRGNNGKQNGTCIRIDEPKLSIALTGTPGQVNNLIESKEDGLFSRFIYYVFYDISEFDFYQEKDGICFKEYFSGLAKKVKLVYDSISGKDIQFLLTQEQVDLFNEFFKNKEDYFKTFVDVDTLSFVRRMGLIAFRISMILTILRNYENKTITQTLTCSDTDYKSALSLIEVYLEHSSVVYNMADLKSGKKAKNRKLKVYESLPEIFAKEEFSTLIKGISQRTFYYYIEDFIEKEMLERTVHGKYQKIKK